MAQAVRRALSSIMLRMSGLGWLSFQFCHSQTVDKVGFLRQIVFICCLSSAAESARIELADSRFIGWVVSRLVLLATLLF